MQRENQEKKDEMIKRRRKQHGMIWGRKVEKIISSDEKQKENKH
jgi:hypothetical protein